MMNLGPFIQPIQILFSLIKIYSMPDVLLLFLSIHIICLHLSNIKPTNHANHTHDLKRYIEDIHFGHVGCDDGSSILLCFLVIKKTRKEEYTLFYVVHAYWMRTISGWSSLLTFHAYTHHMNYMCAWCIAMGIEFQFDAVHIWGEPSCGLFGVFFFRLSLFDKDGGLNFVCKFFIFGKKHKFFFTARRRTAEAMLVVDGPQNTMSIAFSYPTETRPRFSPKWWYWIWYSNNIKSKGGKKERKKI